MNIISLSQIKKRGTGGLPAVSSGEVKCQKCLEVGHRIYQCKNPVAPYVKRPSRTQQLKKPIKLKRERLEKVEKLIPDGTADKILQEKEESRREKTEEGS